MKTSTVLLSTLVAAGAGSVQAMPFFDKAGDMSVSGLVGRSLDSLHKPANEVEHHEQQHGQDHKHTDIDVQAKAGVHAEICAKVLVNGVLRQECKEHDHNGSHGGHGHSGHQDPANNHGNGNDHHGHPRCEDGLKVLQIQIKLLQSEKSKLQHDVTDYKHRIIDYEHKLTLLEATRIHHELRSHIFDADLELESDHHYDNKHHGGSHRDNDWFGHPGNGGHGDPYKEDHKQYRGGDIDRELYHDGKHIDYTLREGKHNGKHDFENAERHTGQEFVKSEQQAEKDYRQGEKDSRQGEKDFESGKDVKKSEMDLKKGKQAMKNDLTQGGEHLTSEKEFKQGEKDFKHGEESLKKGLQGDEQHFRGGEKSFKNGVQSADKNLHKDGAKTGKELKSDTGATRDELHKDGGALHDGVKHDGNALHKDLKEDFGADKHHSKPQIQNDGVSVGKTNINL